MSSARSQHEVAIASAQALQSLRGAPHWPPQVQALADKEGPAAPVSWIPFGLSAGIDFLALALIAFGGGNLSSYLAAAAAHLVAVHVATRFDGGLLGSRRVLAGSLVFALPFTGIALAALALATRPRASLADAVPVDYIEPPTLDPARFHKIAEALSPCEVLSAPGNQEGGATLAALTRRGDTASVGLLRWLVSASTEMAVDAALALEELSMRFDLGLEGHRLALARAPSAASAMEGGLFIARAMQSGLVDPVMLAARADEARWCFALAKKLEPMGADAVTLAWGRMEMAAMHPEATLRMVDAVLARPARGRLRPALTELRDEAWAASHRRAGRGPAVATSGASIRLAA